MFKESGSGEDEYLTDDNGVLWYVPRGKESTLASPRTLIPEVYLQPPRRGLLNAVGEK